MPHYRYLIEQTALAAFSAADADEQRRLLTAFERLAGNPEQAADAVHFSRAGLEIRGKWFGDWLIHYRIDSPVREVVILECLRT